MSKKSGLLRRSVLFGAVATIIALIAGTVFGARSERAQVGVQTVSSNARLALKLEKDWRKLSPPNLSTHVVANCPNPEDAIVLATVGQSNAGNHNSSHSMTLPGEGVFVYYDGGCFVAKDPVPGSGGSGGSLWPDLGKRISARTGRPVVLINGAVGTSQWGDWLDRRSGYLAAFEGRLMEARKAGYKPHMVLWHQGETDARTNVSANVQQKNLSGLADELLRVAPEAKLYVFRVSVCNRGKEAEPNDATIKMQADLSKKSDRIVVGMNTDILGDDYRWDRCHFNSLGREAINTVLEKELIEFLPGSGASPVA